ncbi:hypothetical protein CFP65_3422 [Kitasatospora sp. MMS16-BH015]|uniref:hypothetical protein n=1 Tax=Kitasatospora sp. MMS16-BH015 TaxID=2018025 RepID=UPI000CA2BB41|nr:hypothetical protein [Kitasatospora sp. MMS16-BH015]AUG78218.1 hypothetical protein CFP65_3422 [Kitasatospora sp. MMS16-BH015]
MPRPLLVLPLLLTGLLGLWLARGVLLRWRDLKAARTYELVVEQRPLLLRAGGVVVCGMGVTALTVALALGGRGVLGDAEARVVAAGPGSAPGAAVPAVDAVKPVAVAAPSAVASPSAPAAAPVQFKSVGKPADGELLEGAVAGPDGRPRAVRVWLPAQYKEDQQARFPVIVLHAGGARTTADTELPDVFDGVASAVKLGRARPFVVVAPESPTGTAKPCDLVAAAPQAIADDAALRAAVGAAFRTLPAGPGGWAVLGVEGGAPCAAAAALARPDLYGAAAAVSGRFDAAALAQAGAAAPGTDPAKLLLATAKRDKDGQEAAHRLQTALKAGQGRAAQAQVKLSEVVEDYSAERERLRLVRVAVQYLAESLAHPAG